MFIAAKLWIIFQTAKLFRVNMRILIVFCTLHPLLRGQIAIVQYCLYVASSTLATMPMTLARIIFC